MKMRDWRKLIAACGVAGLASWGALLGASGEALAQDRTVIVDIDGAVFTEPDTNSTVVLRLRAGEQLQIVDEVGDWLKVKLPRGTGWVLTSITREPGRDASLAGRGGGGADRVTIVDDYADVKAGAGDAYLAIKRVFKGDTFELVKTSDDRAWVQLKIGGDLGWVRADQTLRADAVAGSGGGSRGGNNSGGGGNTGGGSVAGGGEGSGGLTDADLSGPDPELQSLIANNGEEGPPKGATDATTSLRVRVGGLVQTSSQSFDSNSESRLLNLYETSSTLFGADISAEYFFIDWVGVEAEYSFGFGQPINVTFDNGTLAELKNSTHRIHGRVIGRYPFGGGPNAPWVGGSVGGAYHRFDIQKTTMVLFVPNTYTGLRVGIDGSVPIGPARLWASGFFVPVASIDQEDLATGDQSDVSQFGAELGVEFEFVEGFGAFGRVIFDRAKATFSGVSARDPMITEAVNRDQFITVGLGVIWRPL